MAVRRNEPEPTIHNNRNQNYESRTGNRNYLPVPMDDYESEVVECVRNNQSSVIIGETGSGKTTRIPDFLLKEFPDAKIAITQPRRVAARSVARYVADRRDEDLGDQIGFQVRFEDQTNEGTRANFMTDGILLRKLQYDHLLMEYDIVMVDEAHERSLNIDFVLGLLKRAQAKRKKQGLSELKVVVTSATIEKEKFSKYFNEAPMIEVPGRMYPVEVNYEKEPIKDGEFAKAAAQKVEMIHATGDTGDILIFMPGEAEIKETLEYIKELKLPRLEAMPLYGAMSPEDQNRIFQKSANRRVIVATNIAETSLTIDGVAFVVDSGLIKQKEFNPKTGIEALNTEEHAKSGCEQRKGRAGRTQPGVCYRLYTEEDYKERADYQTPEIARSNLDHVILAMKKIGIDDVRSFEFIDPPKEAAIAQAIETLQLLGALDEKENLTELGITMAELPLRPEIAKMVIESEKYGCTGKICTIAAMMGEKSVTVRPDSKKAEADAAHMQFYKPGSDFLKMLAIWDKWSATNFSYSWTQENYLNFRQLQEVREVRAQLMRELRNQDIAVDDINGGDEVAIQKCIASGMIQNLMVASGGYGYERALQKKSDSFSSYLDKEDIFAHPSSAAFASRPSIMIGANIVTTTKTYARQCQVVDPKWLPEIAPQILRETAKNVHYDQITGDVMEEVSYAIRGRYDVVAKVERKTTAQAVAHEKFVKAIIDGYVDLPSTQHNVNIIRALRILNNRSGGKVQVPDLSNWYDEQAPEVTNKEELALLGDKVNLKYSNYCSAEMVAEIEKIYPETITVLDKPVGVEYNYKPANLEALYGEERNEKFTATVTIPGEILFKATTTDFNKLKTDSRVEIIYRHHIYTETDLEKLKETVDLRRLEVIWQAFNKPETKIVSTKVGEALPWLDSVGAYPIPFAKNYKGETVFGYPAYQTEATYDYINGGSKYTYKLTYFQSESDAKYFTENSHATKAKDDEEKIRKAENQILLPAAKERYAQLDKKIINAETTYSAYGLTYRAYATLRDKWYEVSNALAYTSSANPKKANALMDEIEAGLAGGEAERIRRIALIPEARAKENSLYSKVTKLNHSNYGRFGITYDGFLTIQRNWLRIQKLLETDDGFGDNIMPDPEEATRLLSELDQLIPENEVSMPMRESFLDRRATRVGNLNQAARTTEFFGSNAFTSLSNLTAKVEPTKPKKQTSPVIKETPKPVEKEVMTETLREEFAEELVNTRFFLDAIRAIPEPDKKADNADKISKLRIRSAEYKKDLNALEQELANSDDVARIRGKVTELVKKSEKSAGEIIRLLGGREDWPERFKNYMPRAIELAKIQELELDEPTLTAIKSKIVELSRRQGDIKDLDGELESIIIDAL